MPREGLKAGLVLFLITSAAGILFGMCGIVAVHLGETATRWLYRGLVAALAAAALWAGHRWWRAQPGQRSRVGLSWAVGGLAGVALACAFWSAAGAAVLKATLADAARSGLLATPASGLARADDVAQLYLGLNQLPAVVDESRGRADTKALNAFLAEASTGTPSEAEYARAAEIAGRYQDGLAVLDRAAALPSRSWSVPPANSLQDTPLPQHIGLVEVSRAAMVRAVLLARAGRGAEGVESVRAALCAGQAAGTEDDLIGPLADAYVTELALLAAPAVLRAAPPGLARERWLPFLDAEAWTRNFRRRLELERVSHLADIAKLRWLDLGRVPLAPAERTRLRLYWPFVDLDLASGVRAEMLIGGLLSQPYSATSPVLESKYEDALAGVWIFAGLTELESRASYFRFYDESALAAARESLALAVLDAADFRAKKGRWPDGVTEVDPFSSKPLRAAALPDGSLLLYSVGPDGVDDHGAPFDEGKMAGDIAVRL